MTAIEQFWRGINALRREVDASIADDMTRLAEAALMEMQRKTSLAAADAAVARLPAWIRWPPPHEPADQQRLIICLDDGTVGEAYFNGADSERDTNRGWWWANTAPGDFDGNPRVIPEGTIRLFTPMPVAPPKDRR